MSTHTIYLIIHNLNIQQHQHISYVRQSEDMFKSYSILNLKGMYQNQPTFSQISALKSFEMKCTAFVSEYIS